MILNNYETAIQVGDYFFHAVYNQGSIIEIDPLKEFPIKMRFFNPHANVVGPTELKGADLMHFSNFKITGEEEGRGEEIFVKFPFHKIIPRNRPVAVRLRQEDLIALMQGGEVHLIRQLDVNTQQEFIFKGPFKGRFVSYEELTQLQNNMSPEKFERIVDRLMEL